MAKIPTCHILLEKNGDSPDFTTVPTLILTVAICSCTHSEFNFYMSIRL